MCVCHGSNKALSYSCPRIRFFRLPYLAYSRSFSSDSLEYSSRRYFSLSRDFLYYFSNFCKKRSGRISLLPMPSGSVFQTLRKIFHHLPSFFSSDLSDVLCWNFSASFYSDAVPSASGQCYHLCTIFRIGGLHRLPFPVPLPQHHNPVIQQCRLYDRD